MKAVPPQYRQTLGKLFLLSTCSLQGAGGLPTHTQVTNPIGRIARVFDSQLVRVEDRVQWLRRQLATYAQHTEHPLKVGIGHRGYRSEPSAPDPSITLDLGAEVHIDDIYLIPAQKEYTGDPGIFPKRFTLELSTREDFGQRTILFTSGNTLQPHNDGTPVPFEVNASGRYVRLTVQEGHNKGTLDLFGLSEFVVIAQGEPVSFGAKVVAEGSLNAPGIWFPEALVDGRTPLGIWQNGIHPSATLGDSVTLPSNHETVTWTVNLGETTPVDRVVLFPYQLNRSFEASVLPENFELRLSATGDDQHEATYQWANPLPGASTTTPIVIPLTGQAFSSVSIHATRPWIMGDRNVHAMSELQVWSGGNNVALNLPVTRIENGQTTEITSLTDGCSSEKPIIPVSAWLKQLCERERVERELASLNTVHYQLASRSELNATWGSAVILGLTFLIPVFIVERRRMTSKRQLDQIRKRIASDLHDDIGSNLGSISLIARTARKGVGRLEGSEEIADDLGEVETIARESSLAMRDIVWLLERRQDSIGDLVQRMRDTANRLLRDVECTLECESTKTASKLSLDSKRHLFLFYKECLHNIFKHSKADRVRIRLWDNNDELALEIEDNGVGLPDDGNNQLVSVRKLQDRARLLLAKLEVSSAPNQGTTIRLFVKRSLLSSQPNSTSP
ncbi:MAG: histidine kinase [Verrucomicrobiales bacterium]|nr:histidine kinase [Verrucomicrobiota bacterium JB025]